MNKLPPMYRIYRTGKPYVHLGNVEAQSRDEALEKAVKGIWKKYFALPTEQPTATEGLVAFE